jgi:hypothetical protein
MAHHHFDGWLVVKRYDALKRDPVPPLTGDSVRKLYRGFDGIVWPVAMSESKLQRGLLPRARFNEAIRYWASIKQADIDLLCICLAPLDHGSLDDDPRLRFRGYDYGNFVSEDNYFSSVLNEVIYGVNDEMRAFTAKLNAALLFDALGTANALGDAREALKAARRPLESEEPGEEFGPIGIFVPRI